MEHPREHHGRASSPYHGTWYWDSQNTMVRVSTMVFWCIMATVLSALAEGTILAKPSLSFHPSSSCIPLPVSHIYPAHPHSILTPVPFRLGRPRQSPCCLPASTGSSIASDSQRILCQVTRTVLPRPCGKTSFCLSAQWPPPNSTPWPPPASC